MSEFTINVLDEITCETLQSILQMLKEHPDATNINLNISSYGGEVMVAFAIIDALSQYHTTANVLGFACSAAAILALSCDEVSMSEHASMMIHSAWNEYHDAEDPGIKRCNALQLEIIRKRCPEYTAEMLITDKWLSADECFKLGLTDNININDDVDYAATCMRYAAKLDKLSYRRPIMNEIKIDEVLEEVKEDQENAESKAEEEAPVEDEPKAEEMPEEKPDLIDVVEKLAEKINELEARLKCLEEPMEDTQEPKADDDSEENRINNLYKAICKPSAAVPVVCASTKKTIQKVRKDFEKYTRI